MDYILEFSVKKYLRFTTFMNFKQVLIFSEFLHLKGRYILTVIPGIYRELMLAKNIRNKMCIYALLKMQKIAFKKYRLLMENQCFKIIGEFWDTL